MATPRTGRDVVLPVIRTAYTDDYVRDVGVYTPRDRLTERERGPSRYDHLEDRLARQEKNTHALLEQAYKVKEDILENLNYAHGTWQDEKQARQLLHDHVRTITEVVRKISKDIQILEESIKSREVALEGTSGVVKNLEVNHVAGLTDVRGRVARCDASISRLSSDLKTCYDSIKLLTQQQQESNNKIMEKLSSLDAKITLNLTRIDRMESEQAAKIKQVEGDSSQQMSVLDAKTQGLIAETRSLIQSQKTVEESEREKLETRLASLIDHAMMTRDVKQEKYEKKISEMIASVNKQLNQMEEEIFKEKDRSRSDNQALQSKMKVMIDNADKQYTQEMNKLKHESREGFATVHESISNMKTVMDGKRKLLEEQVRKEIGQIRKMVVLI